MRLSRWSHALLAAFVLAGCKSEKPAVPAVQDSGPPVAKITPPPVPEPVPVPKVPPEPALSLSFLQPTDPERCEWVRQPLPSGERISVFSFNAACDRSMVSWSADGKQGLVFTWPSGEGEVPKAWRVDVAARTGAPLDLKPLPGGKDVGGQDKPYIEEVSFDEQGRPVAIISDVYVTRKVQKGKGGQKTLSYEGQSYPLPEAVEGMPGLAHAFRWEEGGWKHVETKASGFESDLAPGTHELETLKTLGPIAKASTPERGMPGGDAPENIATKLNAVFPGQEETGQWMVLSTPGGPVYFRGAQGGETLYPSVPMAWEEGGKLVGLEGLLPKPDDVVDVQLEDGLLLVAGYGDPRSVQLWDSKTKQRIFSATDANAPAFWPKPAAAASPK